MMHSLTILHAINLKSAIVFCCLIFLPCSYANQEPLFKKEMKNLQIQLETLQPQLTNSIIAFNGEKNTYSYSGSHITSDSQFYIGSLTKQLTAFIFLDLLRKKHPDNNIEALLHRKLSEEFPDSPILKDIERNWINKISLLDLLTHRSGLSDYIDVYETKLKQSALLNKPIPAIRLLQAIQFDPAKRHHYSNTNYFLLGKLIEEMQAEPFDIIFDKAIKSAAKMHYSFAPTQGNFHALVKEKRFQQLTPDINTEVFIDFANAIGTGNIISTSHDLLNWNKYFYQEANSEIRKVMIKNYFQDEDGDVVHLGLSTSKTNFGPLIGFQGSQDSYHSFLGYLPSHQLSVVILSNNLLEFEKLMSVFREFLEADLSTSNKLERLSFFSDQNASQHSDVAPPPNNPQQKSEP